MPTRPPTHAQLLRRARGRSQGDRDYDRQRRERDPRLAFAARVYRSNRWQNLRALQLTREPLCEDCRRHGVVEPATQVDHVVGLVLRPDLAYDLANSSRSARRVTRARAPPSAAPAEESGDERATGPPPARAEGGRPTQAAVGPRAGAWERHSFHGLRGFASPRDKAAGVPVPRRALESGLWRSQGCVRTAGRHAGSPALVSTESRSAAWRPPWTLTSSPRAIVSPTREAHASRPPRPLAHRTEPAPA